jgi:hypothetical protein
MKVSTVKPLSGSRIEVAFVDGRTVVVSLAGRLFGPMFLPLADDAFFRQATVDEFGAVTWPNGADLAPDALHALATGEVVPAAH